MNLCVRAETAQKVRFNPKMITGSENLFGYEVTKFGKMIYNPKAKVWHNHRSTWKGFFRQQKNYAMWWFIMYPMNSRKKHGGDHISTNRMILQVPLLEGIIGLMFLAIFIPVLIYPALMLLAIMLFMHFSEFLSMRLPVRLYPLAFIVYSIRSFAFVVTANGS
jgi:GT2 family glycosyltransferase